MVRQDQKIDNFIVIPLTNELFDKVDDIHKVIVDFKNLNIGTDNVNKANMEYMADRLYSLMSKQDLDRLVNVYLPFSSNVLRYLKLYLKTTTIDDYINKEIMEWSNKTTLLEEVIKDLGIAMLRPSYELIKENINAYSKTVNLNKNKIEETYDIIVKNGVTYIRLNKEDSDLLNLLNPSILDINLVDKEYMVKIYSVYLYAITNSNDVVLPITNSNNKNMLNFINNYLALKTN